MDQVISSFPFTVDECKGYIQHVSKNSVIIRGNINGVVHGDTISYLAAAPADLRASYTGSGLPYPSAAMALEGTPNRGEVRLESNNSFNIQIMMPNSYYAALGTVIVPPTVYLTYRSHKDSEVTIPIKVGESIPFRSLTYPNARTSAMFYDTKLPVRSQEQILRDSEYPCEQLYNAGDFWGLRPAM